MKAETILIVDDEKLIRWSLTKVLKNEGYTVVEAAATQEALSLINDNEPDLILLDQRLPDGTGTEMLCKLNEMKCNAAVIMLTLVHRTNVVVEAMKLGAFDYITKPVNFEELKIVVEKALETARIKRQLEQLREEQFNYRKIIGLSIPMKRIHDFIHKVALSDNTTVLITGESGTGKELVARAIHALSDRKDKLLTTVNCSALSETIIESELFGHERGAFTDARVQKKGLFEIANNGTIFLDEIGDISQAMQVKLLRVLEERNFKRVGGTKDISVNIRVIAATNQNLIKLINEGKFREDLYYRINVASVHLPPLRERGDDVLLLAEHFLQQYNSTFRKQFKGLSEDTRKLFLNYSWPGNIRELRNVIERAVLLNNGSYLLPFHIELRDMYQVNSDTNKIPADSYPKLNVESTSLSLEEMEKEVIAKALKNANNNQSEAARLLKISRDTLRYRMKKYGLSQIRIGKT